MMERSKKTVAILILSLFSFLSAHSQNYSLAQTDSITYKLYMEQDWETLMQIVSKNEKENQTFYYLYVRGAIAAFYKQQYHQAMHWFQKAESFQTGNDYINELHYLSAKFAQWPIETERLYNKLSAETKKRYRAPKKNAISYIGTLVGVASNADFSQLKDNGIDGAYQIYGNRMMLKNYLFEDLNVGHVINSRLSFSYHFEHIKLNKLQEIYTYDFVNNEASIKAWDHSTTQYLFNAVGHYNLNDLINISLGMSYMKFNSSYTLDAYDAESFTYSFGEELAKDDIKSISLSSVYNGKHWKPVLALSLIQTPVMNNYQCMITNSFKPFTKKELYAYFSIVMKTEENPALDKLEWEPLFKAGLSYHWKKAWLDLAYSYGNHKNYLENNGALIYNTAETIRTKRSVTISYPLFKQHLWINMSYANSIYESESLYFNDNYNSTFLTFSHNTNSLSGGLIWYF